MFLVFGCINKDNNPKAVAKTFLNHINNKEYAEARKCATPESGSMLDFIESMDKDVYKGSNDKSFGHKYSNIRCKEDGDKATCKYNMDDKEKKIHLVKKDGQWLVDYKKENPEDNDSWADDEADYK